QYIFYNLVEPSQVGLYTRPLNVAPEVWEQGVRENPDPSCLVPVIATGFDDLHVRVKAQTDTASNQQKVLQELKSRLEALREKHAVNNISRLQKAQFQQTQLTQRLLAFIQHLHLLIPAVRSSSLRPEEEQLRGQLEEIAEEIRRGRLKGRLNELWALLGAVNASRPGGAAGGVGDWAVVDEDGLAQISQILTEQQNGLAHLTKILQKDSKDLSIITGTKSSSRSDGSSGSTSGGAVGGNDSESLWNSTSTLRASVLR
ncbi:hypothetical protein BDN72DRAFT_757282, partial [Pluteus cervinus]